MKLPVIFGIIALLAPTPLPAATRDPRAPFDTPQSIVPQIAAADYAVISPVGFRMGIEKGNGPITVKGHGWIRAVAQQLHNTAFERTDNILGVTTNVTFFNRDGKRLHELQVFPERVRLDGLDYHVDAITNRTLRAMVQLQRDNDAPGPAPGAASSSR